MSPRSAFGEISLYRATANILLDTALRLRINRFWERDIAMQCILGL